MGPALRLSTLAVFCGSSPGFDPAFAEHAHAIGRQLAEQGIRVVYGAGGSGLMGAVADGALQAGGEVIGVIPRSMVEREWGRADLTELIVCETMHQRKALMADKADAFLALPGGLGTLEEIFEVWTWLQLGYHAKPVGFLDDSGFWRPLLDALAGIGAAGFIRHEHLESVVVAGTLDDALAGLRDRLPPQPHTVAPGT